MPPELQPDAAFSPEPLLGETLSVSGESLDGESQADASLAGETIVLPADYRLALALLGLSLPLYGLSLWLGGVVTVFALFLAVQTRLIRLEFTSDSLVVRQGRKPLRTFPYQEWQYWRIFWGPVPILFYFREVKSIHFVPMVFAPRALRQCLEARVPLPAVIEPTVIEPTAIEPTAIEPTVIEPTVIE